MNVGSIVEARLEKIIVIASFGHFLKLSLIEMVEGEKARLEVGCVV